MVIDLYLGTILDGRNCDILIKIPSDRDSIASYKQTECVGREQGRTENIRWGMGEMARGLFSISKTNSVKNKVQGL